MAFRLRKNNYPWIGVSLFMVILVMVTFSGFGYADGPDNGGVTVPQHYPEKFAGVGRIDRMAKNEIVIDDSLYKLSPFATFHTPKRSDVSTAWFRLGNLVGFLTNDEREITSLWLLK